MRLGGDPLRCPAEPAFAIVFTLRLLLDSSATSAAAASTADTAAATATASRAPPSPSLLWSRSALAASRDVSAATPSSLDTELY